MARQHGFAEVARRTGLVFPLPYNAAKEKYIIFSCKLIIHKSRKQSNKTKWKSICRHTIVEVRIPPGVFLLPKHRTATCLQLELYLKETVHLRLSYVLILLLHYLTLSF
jgi:hypothetical protein